jgi:cytidyltransferase-like protein
MRTTFFIGKFMPFHEGHKLILDTLLLMGDDVTIGIKREISKQELRDFKKELKEIYGRDFRIVEMGWFDRIAHGRKTGYTFDRIPTPRNIETISATQIRKEMEGGAK